MGENVYIYDIDIYISGLLESNQLPFDDNSWGKQQLQSNALPNELSPGPPCYVVKLSLSCYIGLILFSIFIFSSFYLFIYLFIYPFIHF
jgi:hypothetical protein